MLAFHIYRGRNIPHGLSGIPFIDLEKALAGVPGSFNPYRVVENPLGPVADLVLFLVAGYRLLVASIMGRQIAIGIDRYGKNDALVVEKFILQGQDGLIHIKIIFGMEFGWIEIADLFIIGIKPVGNTEDSVIDRLFDELPDHLGADDRLDLPPAQQFHFQAFALLGNEDIGSDGNNQKDKYIDNH